MRRIANILAIVTLSMCYLSGVGLAKDKIIMGVERRSMIMPEEERRNTAYHEAGHATVSWLL